MGLSFGGKYPCQATVWRFESKGKYTDAQISTSKKGQDGNYVTDFSSYVRMVGAAHEKVLQLEPKDRITITNFEITKTYDKSKGKEYVNIVVFDFDAVKKETEKAPDTDFLKIPDDIGDLPFK